MTTVAGLLVLTLSGSVQIGDTPAATPNRLSRLEADAGWHLLFDGETTQGWHAAGRIGFPAQGWEVQDGALHHLSGRGGGDILTDAFFGDFELEFEWRVAKGANSGLKYLVREDEGRRHAYGPEYQILDNAEHADGNAPKTSAAALYALCPPEYPWPAPAGEYNKGRIVVRDGRLEHWLNGTRVLAIDTGSERWRAALATSKFAGDSDFATPGLGRIALQDHGDEVWFRSLKLRELPAAVGREVELYDGLSLEPWREIGDARYVADGDAILGEVEGGGQSFLVTRRTFGDFVLEMDVLSAATGNSGIQIRSHQREDGQLYGYQIEIDPSSRSWSGGLYDEGRRAWLQNLADNPAGRESFKIDEWNRYRIEAVGPWIRASVNGIPTVDYLDTFDLEGVVGLQVHMGEGTRVRWRSPRLWDMGRREWSPLAAQILESEGGRVSTWYPAPALEHAGELTMRLAFKVETGEFQMVAHAAPAESIEFAPATRVLEYTLGSWRITPGLSEHFVPFEWNELGLVVDGDRVVILLAGRKAAEARGPFAAAGDGVGFLSAGSPGRVLLKNIQILGDAVERRDDPADPPNAAAAVDGEK